MIQFNEYLAAGKEWTRKKGERRSFAKTRDSRKVDRGAMSRGENRS